MIRRLNNDIKLKIAIERLLPFFPHFARKSYGQYIAIEAVKDARKTEILDDPCFDANSAAFLALTKRLIKNINLLCRFRDNESLETVYINWEWLYLLLKAAGDNQLTVNKQVLIRAQRDFLNIGEKLGKGRLATVANKMEAQYVKEGIDREWIIGIALSVFLFIGVFSLPYWYYTLLRFVSTVGFCGMAFLCFDQEKKILMFAALGLAFLFNPLYPIYMSKDSWVIWDAIASLYALYLTYNLKTKV